MTAYGELLYAQGLLTGASGNISTRLDAHRILITPGGCHKGMLTASELVVIDMKSGKVLSEGSAMPSSELRMHTYIYAQQPAVQAVIHAHPPYVVALGIAGVSLEKAILPESVLALGSIADCGYATPTTDAVVEAIMTPVQSGAKALVLDRHGSVTMGSNLHEAFCRLETLEHLAKVVAIAGSLNEIEGLPADEIKKLQKLSTDYKKTK